MSRSSPLSLIYGETTRYITRFFDVSTFIQYVIVCLRKKDVYTLQVPVLVVPVGFSTGIWLGNPNSSITTKSYLTVLSLTVILSVFFSLLFLFSTVSFPRCRLILLM